MIEEVEVPLVITGDIFHDGWRERKCSPELINFTIRMMRMLPDNPYVVAGNHDLPHHDYGEIHRSGIRTLAMSGVIKEMTPGVAYQPLRSHGIPNFFLHGFHWGFNGFPKKEELKKWESKKAIEEPNSNHIAVVHAHCWDSEHTFPGADSEDWFVNWGLKLKESGFAAATFGDNHKGFINNGEGKHVPINNGGGFMIRRSDERDYRPFMSLLRVDFTWVPVYFDTSKDVYLSPEEVSLKKGASESDFTGFTNLMRQICGDVGLDYGTAVRRAMNSHKLNNETKAILVKSLEASEE